MSGQVVVTLALMLAGGTAAGLAIHRWPGRRARAIAPRVEGPPADPMVRRTIGPWLLTRPLGQGGSAAVYQAVPSDTQDESAAVAIKVLFDPAQRGRFEREIQICWQLRHPNVVEIRDWGTEPVLYLVMELVRGSSLRRRMTEPMSSAQVLAMMAPVFDAVAYAHEQGVIHTDLKPENILVDDGGHVRVMDFGLATGAGFIRLTGINDVLGTPGYMAPEAINGQRGDALSDQYALGVIMFELLTGGPPVQGSSVTIMLQQISQPVPPMPGVPQEMAWAIRRMMAKLPEDRYATVREAWAGLISTDIS